MDINQIQERWERISKFDRIRLELFKSSKTFEYHGPMIDFKYEKK